MKAIWPWIAGLAVAGCIVILLAYGHSERRAYWIARGAVFHRVQASAQATPTVWPGPRR
jgi:hypothetical protein